MLSSSTHHRHRQTAALAALGMLLVGVAGVPAHAESTREQQWHLDAMKVEQMWQTSTGEGVTVAVIDSGVDPANPDLKGRVLPGKDYASDQPGDEHTDYSGHGTGMAGLIAGTGAWGGGRGAFGLAPGAQILPIRVPTGDTAANKAEGDKRFNEITPKAIRFAADRGADVINISLAATEGSPQLTEAVSYALGKGSLIFAGVGNDAEEGNPLMYPAATPGVVGVAAVGKDLHRAAESQHGPQVDMAAPGEDMVAPCGSESGLCRSHGTSDATALASASAALIWSEHPAWTNNQVLRVMLNTIGAPTDGAKRNDSIGYGIVRPRIALQDPGDPGPADVYPLPDLAAVASKAPSPEASRSEDSTPAVAANEAGQSSGNTMLWIAVGFGGAALLGALTVIAAVSRKRRRSLPPAPVPTYSSQYPYADPTFMPPPGAQDSGGRSGPGRPS
ncbi:type VII secretion-associated serine protease mycosin [Streptomyces sp. KR55]|uniref:type VII secretion-associated serine protease mycosin n=1 Tax=Streptomyces sp. KR55 TaxID=3457425 RepID=UPI003FD434C4